MDRAAIAALKAEGRIVVVTAYDYPTARLVDEAGAEVILVGDSLGMVVLGWTTYLPVTMETLHHTRGRAREAAALVVADPAVHELPDGPIERCGTPGASVGRARRSVSRRRTAEAVRAITSAGIPG
jgi:3-methyl-2-oxobutanoate hydroxymethyltransferase